MPRQKRFQVSDEKKRYQASPFAELERPLSPYELKIAKSIEGFPQGEIAAIQAMSIPPYYTACPNPFISQIVAAWQDQKKSRFVKDKKRLITASLSHTMSPKASKIRYTRFTLIILRFPHALSYIIFCITPIPVILSWMRFAVAE